MEFVAQKARARSLITNCNADAYLASATPISHQCFLIIFSASFVL
jgi:hypothetical protein